MNVAKNDRPNLKMTGPDFIGVGPEKTGTTWIYSQLYENKNVNLTSLKELRYFWEDFYFPLENPILRILNKNGWHREQYRKQLRRLIKRTIYKPITTVKNVNSLKWDLSYIFRTHSLKWYLGRFDKSNQAICGEISPQYFFLDLSQIKKIQALESKPKIIITLRDPEEWLSSFLAMAKRKGHFKKNFDNIDEFVTKKYLARSFSDACEDWINVFGRSNIAIFFYDDLVEDPWAYYLRICEFLKISPDMSRKSKVGDRVNSAPQKPTRIIYGKRVEDAWRNDVTRLKELVDNVPTNWIRKYT